MNRGLKIIVGGICLSVNLTLNAAEVVPQQSAPQPSPPVEHSPPRKITRLVWPHELMNFQERYDLWSKMRAAHSPVERIELLAKKYAQLEKRATELGLGLREPDLMVMMRYEEHHPTLREENRWEPQMRESLSWGHPNLGYGPRYEPLQPRYEPLQPRYESFRPYFPHETRPYFPPMGR